MPGTPKLGIGTIQPPGIPGETPENRSGQVRPQEPYKLHPAYGHLLPPPRAKDLRAGSNLDMAPAGQTLCQKTRLYHTGTLYSDMT